MWSGERMTETNHSQTIPVSPNVFPTKNKKMTEPTGYKLNPNKLKKAPQGILPYVCGAFHYTEDYEYFDVIKPYLDFPEEPKGIEYYQKELDKKFEELLVKIKRKSHLSKQIAERKYEDKFDRIFDNFQYAVKNGVFPQRLYLATSGNSLFTVNGGGLSVNNAIISNVNTHNIVINSNVNNVGYWESKPIFKVYFNKRPNWLSRICAKIIFDITWKSV
jgi:hypothetical protein